MVIKWDDSLSVDVPQIDEQHKMLISIIQTLQQKTDKEHVSRCLDDLIDYAGFHFNDEEIFMQQHNYSDFEKHKKTHAEFIKKVTSMIKDFETRTVQSEKLLLFLIDWLINHIKHTDKLYMSDCC